MDTRILKVLLIAAALLGCESRNPADISAERQDRPTPTRLPRRIEPPPPAPGREPPPPVRIVPKAKMRGGTQIANNPQPIPDTLKKLNLRAMMQTGDVSIQANDSAFIARLGDILDGNTTTLHRTENVSPLILTLTFNDPIRLKTVRLFPSYSNYDWAVHPSATETGFLIRNAPEEQWSRIDFPEAKETKTVCVEVLRLLRDDYVHVNELEIYTE